MGNQRVGIFPPKSKILFVLSLALIWCRNFQDRTIPVGGDTWSSCSSERRRRIIGKKNKEITRSPFRAMCFRSNISETVRDNRVLFSLSSIAMITLPNGTYVVFICCYRFGDIIVVCIITFQIFTKNGLEQNQKSRSYGFNYIAELKWLVSLSLLRIARSCSVCCAYMNCCVVVKSFWRNRWSDQPFNRSVTTVIQSSRPDNYYNSEIAPRNVIMQWL